MINKVEINNLSFKSNALIRCINVCEEGNTMFVYILIILVYIKLY